MTGLYHNLLLLSLAMYVVCMLVSLGDAAPIQDQFVRKSPGGPPGSVQQRRGGYFRVADRGAPHGIEDGRTGTLHEQRDTIGNNGSPSLQKRCGLGSNNVIGHKQQFV